MEVRHNRGGKLPRPQGHYENRPRSNQSYDESIDYKPKGRPYPIEKPYKFQGQALGQILNITSHDPQLWNSVIDVRKYPILVYVWKKYPTNVQIFRNLFRRKYKGIMGIIQDKPSKKSQYRFCKNIFTPQTYGIEEKKKKYKPYKKYNKRYFLKRSTRRKPYLDPNRHVKKI